jgi:hypothetical protein
MGYVKYREDDNDAIEERVYNHSTKSKDINRRKIIQCYFCNFECDSIDRLNEHIRSTHNILSPIVVLNGRVIHYRVYTKSIIDARIVFFGYTNVNVKINGLNITGNESDSTDITERLVHNSINTVSIGNDNITIYHLPELIIRNGHVDKKINEWEVAIANNRTITNDISNQLNEAEKYYLDGFFNYYMACTSEREKAKRYEDAYSMLMSFDNKTSASMCVLRIMAFRLNWVEKLKQLSKGDSVFESACNFFCDKPETDISSRESDVENSLYIETPIEESLNAIVEYQRANFVAVHQYIDKFTDDTLLGLQDVNLRDRILLLKARMARGQGKDSKACALYKCIKTPYFSLERDRFCLNLGRPRR